MNEKQIKFCEEYLKELNATKAYMQVYGTDEKVASVNACRMLRNASVQHYIKERFKKRQEKMEINADKILMRLASIAFGHLGVVCIWGDNGLELKDSSELTSEEISIIDSVDISPVGSQGEFIGYRKRVKLKDSLKALELLYRHLGLDNGRGTDNEGKRNSEAVTDTILRAIERVKARITSGVQGGGETPLQK